MLLKKLMKRILKAIHLLLLPILQSPSHFSAAVMWHFIIQWMLLMKNVFFLVIIILSLAFDFWWSKEFCSPTERKRCYLCCSQDMIHQWLWTSEPKLHTGSQVRHQRRDQSSEIMYVQHHWWATAHMAGNHCKGSTHRCLESELAVLKRECKESRSVLMRFCFLV